MLTRRQFIPYYGFSAVVALYVYAIQKRSSPPETYLTHFRSASRCHSQLESIATRGSLMQRYGVVLEELRVEVLRHNHSLAAIVTPGPIGDDFDIDQQAANLLPSRHPHSGMEEFRHSSDGDRHGLAGMVGDMDRGALAVHGAKHSIDLVGGDLTHMTNWGLFDSLVSSEPPRLSGNAMTEADFMARRPVELARWIRCSRARLCNRGTTSTTRASGHKLGYRRSWSTVIIQRFDRLPIDNAACHRRTAIVRVGSSRNCRRPIKLSKLARIRKTGGVHI